MRHHVPREAEGSLEVLVANFTWEIQPIKVRLLVSLEVAEIVECAGAKVTIVLSQFLLVAEHVHLKVFGVSKCFGAYSA